MHSLPLLILIVVHGLGVAALVTWFYESALLPEFSNLLPGSRPTMYLRQDFDEWLVTTRAPGWLQTLLTCSKCGTAHASFWLVLPTAITQFHRCAPASSLIFWLLLWAGSAGFSMLLKKQLR